ncbi:hypothetical protein SAMN06265365_11324 [Tistlia consotensis]|uniref:ER-bound oxygenase mpaB/mpaB'/Rubber oxygenase catalytic domain-containing protein n=1 Tax=Tistlia consotensis USBA 355 TaxID=560819 RepID=A0A1Y6C4T9_9PROT|nr:oxygenase MpaB family protein [Tistlia consotensis]SMF41792.1 hypothetical protein SAMN05428998_114121 [Tistlia consotensis USBA 355]SNR73407.1 hypothetical protein SAMN06265365_11324 [Tistlia consotensis]
MTVLEVPSAYREGYARGATVDAALTERYLRHTTIGDPEADAVMAALNGHPVDQLQGWLRRGLDGGAGAIPDAPAVVRDFFDAIEPVPTWFDAELALPGCRAFHRHSEMFIGAFVGAVLIEGFSTLISQSFYITGRVIDQGVNRLKQNNRHLVEIFMPGGLERGGDGWKLSVRIRLMHARVRQLLDRSPEWDAAAWGRPLSAAHIGYAAACFSGLLLTRARMLGVELSDEERESFMTVWRYSGILMGVPEALSCATQAEALRLHRIGQLCEPPPTDESIIMANCLVNSAPVVAGITEPRERDRLTRRIYQVSRALIGDELAGQLNFPPARTFGTLTALRLKNRLEGLAGRLVPTFRQRRLASQFQRMLEVSFYTDEGMRYRMPEKVHAEEDVPQ